MEDAARALRQRRQRYCCCLAFPHAPAKKVARRLHCWSRRGGRCVCACAVLLRSLCVFVPGLDIQDGRLESAFEDQRRCESSSLTCRALAGNWGSLVTLVLFCGRRTLLSPRWDRHCFLHKCSCLLWLGSFGGYWLASLRACAVRVCGIGICPRR
jgi:hypothetical protein